MWRSHVYHLPLMYLVVIKIRIMFSASEFITLFFAIPLYFEKSMVEVPALLYKLKN